MGRKKSKTAKQKQAKKQQKSKFGGISVKKASGGRERRKQQARQELERDNNNNKSRKHANNNNKKTQRNRSFKHRQHHQFASLSPSASKKVNSARSPLDTDEHADFDQQMASAQERQSAKQHAKTMRNRKHTPAFAPASFVVDDHEKSTSRLLHEAATKIHSGLEGIGSKATVPMQQSSLSLAAGITSSAWTATTTNEPSVLECNNPYAALESDDSISEGDSDTKQQERPPTLPLFRFASPTFIAGTNAADNVDPDL